jgi:hypothetical protein
MVYNYTRFEKEPQHHAIMCYAPLAGFCAYPEGHNNIRNILFPPGLSPFAEITMYKPSDLYSPSDASSKIFESSFFRAIVKFKWHAFARWRFFGIFLFYFINAFLFTVMISVNAWTIDKESLNTVTVSSIIINRILTIASIISEILNALFVLRWLIISILKRISVCSRLILMNVIAAFSVVTAYLEYRFLSLFLRIDSHEQFFHNASWYLNTLPYLRCVSILITWLGSLIFICSLSRSLGFFIIGN